MMAPLCCRNRKDIEVKTNLKIDHALFERLKNNPPQWWNNLKSDPDLYIDIRKDNYLNVYHNGGSIMKLEEASEYKAKIHFEYVPLQKDTDYLPFEFQDGNISLNEYKTININNFKKESLDKIKKKIRKFYPNDSEKGIQGQYVINNNGNVKEPKGFFIDTEFQFSINVNQKLSKGRIDLVWVDTERKEIAFVELKTIGDERLYSANCKNPESIDIQLKKYRIFAEKNCKELIKYYDMVFQIKKKLQTLPPFVTEDSLLQYKLIHKPILLVGDCTRDWISDNAGRLNSLLKEIAFGCIYHGRNTYNFNMPIKTYRNCFRLDGK